MPDSNPSAETPREDETLARSATVAERASVSKSGAPRPVWLIWLGALLLAGGVIAAYRGTFSVPMLLDDGMSITDNSTLRHLWPLGPVLSPPTSGTTVSGRPVLNLSLAINYAFGGTRVQGYHALNLAIHLLAGLALFGLVRRTLLLPFWRGRYEAAALPLAWAAAALWALDPLQTESVTYLAQRAESLMGLFYLLTLYCFVRYVEKDEEAKAGRLPLQTKRWRVPLRSGTRQRFVGWAILSAVACLLGMATKEVMVTAPLLVLLYDRTFVAGSFGEAWRRRRRLYLGLAATWILLGILVLGGGGTRNGSAGFGGSIAPWDYGLTQFQAIARYLRLTIWPHPLVFEYGTFWVRGAEDVIPFACVVIPLLVLTGVALRRWPVWGFLGAWYFAILAPTSLVPGKVQMIVEHRLYLPLAAAVVLGVVGGYALLEKACRGRRASGGVPAAAAAAYGTFLLIGCVGLGAMTARRNRDYRSALVIWSDTIAKRPGNALAHNNLGEALRDDGRLSEALGQYERAVQLKPDYAEARSNFGAMLFAAGRTQEALAQDREALRLMPGNPTVHYDLALVLAGTGQNREAQEQDEEALRLKPDYPEAHSGLGDALQGGGRPQEAIASYEEALRLKPDFPEAHNNLGGAFQATGRLPEALAQYEEAVRLKPDFPEARNNLGVVLRLAGRNEEAIAQEEVAVRLKPSYAEAHGNLGVALLATGRTKEALEQEADAVRLKPDYPAAHFNFGNALQKAGRPREAAAQYGEALRLKPDYAEAHSNLGYLLAANRRLPEAIVHYEKAIELKPDVPAFHYNLALALAAVGRVPDAIAHYQRALELKPDFPEAAKALAALQGQPRPAPPAGP